MRSIHSVFKTAVSQRTSAGLDRADICLLSFDTGHFERLNDTHGHAAGEEVLKHFFVTTIQSNLRQVGTKGRAIAVR